MKISFLCFDLSGNSFGRAVLLAQALSNNHEVELIGPASNGALWSPMNNLQLPVKLFHWERLPWFAQVIKGMINAIDGDIIFACKPRLASFGTGLLAASDKPLILDIDDWELGFFYKSGWLSRAGKFLNLSNPEGLPCTWLMEQLVSRADAITVSNKFLQKKFGGELIYHCRDTKILDPKLYNDQKMRTEMNLHGRKIIMFLGTPRAHKGIDDLAKIIRAVKHPDAHLVIIGAGPKDRGPFKQLENIGKATLVSQVPFNYLGNFLALADVVVIPQRDTSETQGQIPAKIFDAMSMARPVVSTRVSDIPEVLGKDGYVVEPGNILKMADTIDYILNHPEEAEAKGRRLRTRCRKSYDARIIEKKLTDLIQGFANPRKKSSQKKID